MRFKKIRINMYAFLQMLVENEFIDYKVKIIKGLPEGCNFCYNFPTGEYSTMYIVIEHESFPELEPGQEIPEIQILFDEVKQL